VSDLTLLVLRLGFLLLLWLFIFAIVFALRSDLLGAPVRRMQQSDVAKGAAARAPQPGSAPTSPPITPSGGALPSANHTGAARTLVITSGVAAGTSIPLDEEFLTIGRSGDSSLVIVDEFTPTYHARLSRRGEQWMLTDLDSTNGTRLDGARITGTVAVPNNTPITIGTTTFELRP